MTSEHRLIKRTAHVDLEGLEEKGKGLYQTNAALRDLGNVMEHPLMREFLRKYFFNWGTSEAMLMLMKTYEQIDAEFPSPQLNPYQKLAVLHDVIRDQRTRAVIRDKMLEFKGTTAIQ